MTVAELIGKLKEMPQDLLVVVSYDPEDGTSREAADVREVLYAEEYGDTYEVDDEPIAPVVLACHIKV